MRWAVNMVNGRASASSNLNDSDGWGTCTYHDSVESIESRNVHDSDTHGLDGSDQGYRKDRY